MKKQAAPDYDILENWGDKQYDELMRDLNQLLDSLWAEIQQDPEYSEFFDDQGPVGRGEYTEGWSKGNRIESTQRCG
jgi:hypothetical protein